MKITISAICKNEEKFVHKWLKCFKQNNNDDIIVIDTGSTDNTVKILRDNGVKVIEKIFDPFSFSEARQYALSFISDDTDWVICPDFDEVLNDGWRDKLETIISNNKDITIIKCKVFTKSEDTNEFYEWLEGNKKIFKNKFYEWTEPIHEYLKPINYHNEFSTDEIILYHTPINSKIKDNYYTELCKKRFSEDEENYYVLLFIVQNSYRNSNWEDTIKYGEKYIELSYKYRIDSSYVCVYVSTAYYHLKNITCIKYALKAIDINLNINTINHFINISGSCNLPEMVVFGCKLKEILFGEKDKKIYCNSVEMMSRMMYN